MSARDVKGAFLGSDQSKILEAVASGQFDAGAVASIVFENNPDMRFTTRSLQAGDDFAVCEWTLNVTKDGRALEWDGVDVFPLRDGLIARKDVYSTSHRPREL